MKNIIHYYNKRNPKGGYTFAYVFHNETIFVGISYCPVKQRYSESIGEERAVNNLNEIIESNKEMLVKAKHLIGYRYICKDTLEQDSIESFLNAIAKHIEETLIDSEVELFRLSKYEQNFIKNSVL